MNTQNHVYKDPVGVVAAFTPWNFPINQIARKLCAALATGCSIIVKAPEETPASPAAFIQCFIDAGVPPGVIGLVYGNPAEISGYLIPHPTVRKITFTGSTPVGKQLAAMAGLHMKRCTMELGGHAPVIVAEDADIMTAVKGAAAAKFRNAGQVCIAPTRFLVHNSIKAEFNAAVLAFIGKLKVGDGMDATSTMGPLANARRVTAMQSLTANAIKSGATLLTGGERIGTVGNFFAPTVLDNVPVTADIFNDEPFGPVVSIRGFDKLEEAIAEANRLPFGLAGYAYTQSLKSAHLLARELQVGMLWMNQAAVAWPELPFGGIKDSGYGSEGGPEALEAYVNTRMVSTVC
jgi:succinate-semialdehyde dehydrogenase/glutarate-semialdehyde dehydrogenase